MQDQPRRLTRSTDRKIGGVSGGLADYFGVDATVIRLGFVLFALLSAGFGAVVAYVVMWAIMPPPDPNAPPPDRTAPDHNSMLLAGIALLVFGVALLWQRLPFLWWWNWGFLPGLSWPLLLIAGGALILIASRRRR